jgi:hypothetical protein
MNKLYQHLTELQSYPLSDRDISQLYQIPVIQSNQIHQVLDQQGQWVIYNPNATLPIGHWTLLSNSGGSLEWFDSYGKPPPVNVLQQIPRSMTIEFNTVPYQKKGNNINTCGFHTLFRAFTQKYLGFNLKQYHQFMKSPKDHDKAVIFYVNNFLHLFQ